MPRRSKPQSIRKRVITRAGAAPAPEFLALLQAAHLTPSHIREIRRRYGAAAHTTVQAHPYRLVRDIAGISFEVADTLARKLGTGKTNPERIRTGVIEVLQQALRNGHTSLPLPVVVKRAAALLGVSRATVEEQCLRGALDVGGEFVVDRRGAQTLLTSVTLRRVEERVAEALAERVRRPLPPVLAKPVEEITSSVAQTCGLNAEQQHALWATLTHPLTVVTGGPGTGKSFFCQALATVAAQQHLPLLAAAPTGRAAQRLTEMAGVPAATLHRLLEYHPGRAQPALPAAVHGLGCRPPACLPSVHPAVSEKVGWGEVR